MGPNRECRDRQDRDLPPRNFLHTCRVRALERTLRFTPSAGRQQGLARTPLRWIDGDNVDIPMKPAMLKAVIKNEDISEVAAFGEESRSIAIRANDDWHISQALSHQARF